MAQTVAALYDTFDDAKAAVNELLRAGFPCGEIDLLANNEDGALVAAGPVGEGAAIGHGLGGALVGAGEGAALGGLAGLGGSLISVLIPGIGPVFSPGSLAATLMGAEWGAPGGGVIGAFMTMGVPRNEAAFYVGGVRNGGTLVILRAESEERAARARAVLQRYWPLDFEDQPAANGAPSADQDCTAIHPYSMYVEGGGSEASERRTVRSAPDLPHWFPAVIPATLLNSTTGVGLAPIGALTAGRLDEERAIDDPDLYAADESVENQLDPPLRQNPESHR